MTSEEQAAYFWSYVLMENTNDRFAEYGVDHPFTDDYLQSFALPHGDDMLVRRLKEANPDWKRQFVQKKKDGKKGRLVMQVYTDIQSHCSHRLHVGYPVYGAFEVDLVLLFHVETFLHSESSFQSSLASI